MPVGRSRIVALALILILASCTSAERAGPRPEPGPGPEPGPEQPAEEAAAVVLPPPFVIDGASPTRSAGPEGATEVAFLAAAGPTPSDPRFIEVTYYTFAGPGDLRAAESVVAGVPDAAIQELAGSGVDFAFLADGWSTVDDRPELQLTAFGPSIDSVFRGPVGGGSLAVGGARVLQPADVDQVLPVLGAGAATGEEVALPLGLEVLVDEPLPAGVVLEVETDFGRSLVEVRDGAAAGWFDFLSWDDPPVDPPVPLAATGARVSVAPPADFGLDGQPTDTGRVVFWTDRRLVVVTHPPEMAPELLARLYLAVAPIPMADLQALAAELDDGQDRAPQARTGRLSDPPDAASLAELQRFVEQVRQIEAGQPLAFEFVDEMSFGPNVPSFVSASLWDVLTALGLTGSGDRAGANAARAARVRGTPGTVVLQPTEVETNMVIVHEMTHLVDPPVAAGPNPEPVIPAQALVEGNAHRVAYRYVASLEPDEQAFVGPAPNIFEPGVDDGLAPAVRQAIEFAYDEGLAFASALAAVGGEATIAEAFDRPPVSTEQVLFPDAWFRADEPVAVPVPDEPEGATIVGHGSLGAFVLALAIVHDPDEPSEIGPTDWRPILARWAGDAYVVYDLGGHRCLRATIELDTESAAADLAAALGHRRRSVASDGTTVDLESCS